MPRLLVLLFCLLPLTVSGAGFTHLSTLTQQGFAIGAQARLLDDGEVLGEIDSARQLSPASVSKLYIAAAALDRWGPQHTFTTRLISLGEISDDGTLHGDLVLEGGGDPALDSRDLWQLVQTLRQRGVERIDGQLIISQWRFGPVDCMTEDRCQARTRTATTYSAQLTSAGVNHGNWCLNVAPARQVGDPARLSSCDTVIPATGLTNRVTTAAGGSETQLNVERVTESGSDVMVVRGQIAQDAFPRTVYRSSSDPAIQTAETLVALLEQAGVAVTQGYSVSVTQPPANARTLAALDGEPLQEVLMRMLNHSNNFMADVLSLNLADTAQASLIDAGAALEGFAQKLPGHGELRLLSGSGLTTENRTSAQGVNALLEHMYRQPALFPSFVAGLQSPANGVMRFIRRGSSTFQEHVMLKTGTLNQPFAVRSVGGYFRTESGRWGVFSVLVNGSSQTPYLNWTKVLDPLARDLEAMIRSR
ncbi:D-alanyl-D-alanine carboxypeptidase/D-alanyl-D-alanine endopeptidase [Litchfieldella xinjiangensis]|uniref:D-alanyl-D-alanine carboxypeptidase/D-alanyl-D-alanine endopeptidase n=1 Tax=Litchfieldella xinjiangensis TaxID=1166948 RepID=UPI0005B8AB93|nr:D-alanyl-D-alanine carboxypeptidase/D-alanyl-D-alanine-endopeptidase [Halomonas xinjiangensis]